MTQRVWTLAESELRWMLQEAVRTGDVEAVLIEEYANAEVIRGED